jgi:3'(2'), 5'-bisphosphate nucleotidase
MTAIPSAIAASTWSERVSVARTAAECAGAGLMALRGRALGARTAGDQLKTAADAAAEGWVLGYLESFFPEDPVLSEERFEREGVEWAAPNAYWTVDALDGTRSFAEGFDGFCTQIAWVEAGVVRVGVVHVPVERVTYLAAEGCGAYRIDPDGRCRRLGVEGSGTWPEEPVFVDSTPPGGPVGTLFARHGGRLLECGSIGLKACRVADGAADVFAKELRFKLWDVAPADRILQEAGGRLGLWTGDGLAYDGRQVVYRDLLAAGSELFRRVAEELSAAQTGEGENP